MQYEKIAIAEGGNLQAGAPIFVSSGGEGAPNMEVG